jgi:hypothetical protein
VLYQRDFEANPYSKDEERVAKWLSEKGIGGGDDPIGFVMHSYDFIQSILRRKGIDKMMEL